MKPVFCVITSIISTIAAHPSPAHQQREAFTPSQGPPSTQTHNSDVLNSTLLSPSQPLGVTDCWYETYTINPTLCTPVLEQMRHSPRFAVRHRWFHGPKDPVSLITWRIPGNRCEIGIYPARPGSISADTFSIQDAWGGAKEIVSRCLSVHKGGQSLLGHDLKFLVSVYPGGRNVEEAVEIPQEEEDGTVE